MIKRIALLAAFLASLVPAAAQELPEGFVYLREIDPSIAQDIRYASSHNFIGRPVEGYEAGECILLRSAAEALSEAQAQLRQLGLSLKVYDCYRPHRAVEDFTAWSKTPEDGVTKNEFYASYEKSNLFKAGWLASRSNHSLGFAVDLGMIEAGAPEAERPMGNTYGPCSADKPDRAPDNSLDFGTAYDCFHENSYTAASDIPSEAKDNRGLLKSVMESVGFENYRREWWHFSLKDAPSRREPYDFPVTPYAGGNGNTGDNASPNVAAGPTVRVVCVPEDNMLNVRDAPDTEASVVSRLPSGQDGVPLIGCNRDVALGAWHELSRASGVIDDAPWCTVALPDNPETTGFVSGAYIFPSKGGAARCE